MEQLYQAANTFRQAFHQWMRPSETQELKTPEDMVIQLARYVRRNFLPGSCSRVLYSFIRKKPELNDKLHGWGRQAFENLCLNSGLRIVSIRFKPKTTFRGDYIFPNRIEGLKIKDINNIWVTDICYIFGDQGKLIGYATTLIDVYSRFLLGLHFSKTMTAEDTSIPVLKQALKIRKGVDLEGCFIHSDGGKQFIAAGFLKLRDSKNMCSSMARNCYENAFAESFNDTLKNHSLLEFELNSFTELKKVETFIKHAYNNYKPHSGIEGLTPIEFEIHIADLKPSQRTFVEIKVIT
jgi:putative transposase